MTEVRVARDKVVTAALRLLAAERALEGAMPHASAADELEYAEDMLDAAARELSSHLSATENVQERT